MVREPLKKLPGPCQPPLYFAGRTAEIDSLREALTTLCSSGDPSNGIELLTGVPGAGKTQLANEYAKRVAGEVHAGRAAHGVLVADEDDYLSFGIPSFHSHMVSRLEKRRLERAARNTAGAGSRAP